MLVVMLQHVSSRVAGFFGAVALSMGEAAKPLLVAGFNTSCNVVLRGRPGALCQSNMFHDVSSVVLCGRRNTLVMFSEDALQFSWLGDLWCHFAWQAHHFRHVLLRIFANRIVRAAQRGDTHHSTLYTLHSTFYTQHFTLYTLQSQFNTSHSTLYTPHFQLYTRHSTLPTLHSTPFTLHFTLHTPLTLYTPPSTLYTPPSTLYTPHFTLHTPNFTLCTPHFIPYTPHFTQYNQHSTL